MESYLVVLCCKPCLVGPFGISNVCSVIVSRLLLGSVTVVVAPVITSTGAAEPCPRSGAARLRWTTARHSRQRLHFYSIRPLRHRHQVRVTDDDDVYYETEETTDTWSVTFLVGTHPGISSGKPSKTGCPFTSSHTRFDLASLFLISFQSTEGSRTSKPL